MSSRALHRVEPIRGRADCEPAAPGHAAAAAVKGTGAGLLVERNGVRCAGAHLIVDLYGARKLDDVDFIRSTLVECVEAAGATLLHIYLHPFEPNGGISGVAVLAESHVSIHSWPEHGYAAVDVFMCGRTRPEACIEVLRRAFEPERIVVQEILRGKTL